MSTWRNFHGDYSLLPSGTKFRFTALTPDKDLKVKVGDHWTDDFMFNLKKYTIENGTVGQVLLPEGLDSLFAETHAFTGGGI